MQTDTGDWRDALETLAALEPTGACRSQRFSPTTPALPRARTSSWSSRPGSRQTSSTVSSTGRRRSGGSRSCSSTRRRSPVGSRPASAALLRLQASGVPVAVLREGDDLARRALRGRRSEATRVRRTALLGSLALLVLAWSWLRLEDGELGGSFRLGAPRRDRAGAPPAPELPLRRRAGRRARRSLPRLGTAWPREAVAPLRRRLLPLLRRRAAVRPRANR